MNVSIDARRLRRSLLVLALLGALSGPVLAQDACVTNPGGATSGTASGADALACGDGSSSTGDSSTAIGRNAQATADFSTAVGGGNLTPTRATALGASAFGNNAVSSGRGATALGANTNAWGEFSSAIGGASAGGDFAIAIGNFAQATAQEALAVGNFARATQAGSSAYGANAVASADNASAFGSAATAEGTAATAIGRNAQATANFSTAVGGGSLGAAQATDIGASAFGNNAISSGFSATALGTNTTASGSNATAIGGAFATDDFAIAIGNNASASIANSVAIGANAMADEPDTVSFGRVGNERRLVHVDDGTEDTDAVNLQQLRAGTQGMAQGIAMWLGGGAGYAGSAFTAPTYVIQSNDYHDVGSAFGAVDAEISDINARILDAGGVQGERGYSAYEVAVNNGYAGTETEWLASLAGPMGPQGPDGPQGPEGPAGDGLRSVVYDQDAGDTLTLKGVDGTVVSNLADGVTAHDAVNKGQMDAGDAATLQSANAHADTTASETLASANSYTDDTATKTLSSANAYTDTRFSQLNALNDNFDQFRSDVDQRFAHTDRRIDRQGAMASAMLNMAINAAGTQSRAGRVAVGAGWQGGESALSIGYGKRFGKTGSFSIGGAISHDEKSAGVGFGFDL